MGPPDRSLQKSMAVIAAVKRGMASVGELKDQCNAAIRRGADVNGIEERQRIPVGGVHGRDYIKLMRADVKAAMKETAIAKGEGALLPGFGDHLDAREKSIATGRAPPPRLRLEDAAGPAERTRRLGDRGEEPTLALPESERGRRRGGDGGGSSASDDDESSSSSSSSSSSGRRRRRRRRREKRKKGGESKRKKRKRDRDDEEEDDDEVEDDGKSREALEKELEDERERRRKLKRRIRDGKRRDEKERRKRRGGDAKKKRRKSSSKRSKKRRRSD